MKKLLTFVLMASILVTSCSTHSNSISYVDSDFEDTKYKKICVVAENENVVWKKIFENAVARELRFRGIQSVPSHALFPPFNQFDDWQIKEKLIGGSYDGYMKIILNDVSYVEPEPPHMTAATLEVASIAMEDDDCDDDDDAGDAALAGLFLGLLAISVAVDVAASVPENNSSYNCSIIDVASDRTSWTATVHTFIKSYSADEFEEAARYLAGELARLLMKDGMLDNAIVPVDTVALND